MKAKMTKALRVISLCLALCLSLSGCANANTNEPASGDIKNPSGSENGSNSEFEGDSLGTEIYDDTEVDPGDSEDGTEPENPGEGIEELTSSLLLYPNPVKDKIYIETPTQTLTVEIYDVYGRHQVTETPSHQDNLTIDVANLKSGIYFVKINTNEGNIVKRIIKQ